MVYSFVVVDDRTMVQLHKNKTKICVVHSVAENILELCLT